MTTTIIIIIIIIIQNCTCLSVNVVSAKVLSRTLFLRLVLETGSPFYEVILATRKSSRLQGKGGTFISQLFLRH